MAEKGKEYQCETCGNIVLVVEAGKGELICCGEKMQVVE